MKKREGKDGGGERQNGYRGKNYEEGKKRENYEEKKGGNMRKYVDEKKNMKRKII